MCRLGLLRLSESNFEPHRGFRPVPPHAPSRFYFWRGGSAADPKIKSIGGEEGEKISEKKFELSTGYAHSKKKIFLQKIL